MSKFHICFANLQGNALFYGKIYTAGTTIYMTAGRDSRDKLQVWFWLGQLKRCLGMTILSLCFIFTLDLALIKYLHITHINNTRSSFVKIIVINAESLLKFPSLSFAL